MLLILSQCKPPGLSCRNGLKCLGPCSKEKISELGSLNHKLPIYSRFGWQYVQWNELIRNNSEPHLYSPSLSYTVHLSKSPQSKTLSLCGGNWQLMAFSALLRSSYLTRGRSTCHSFQSLVTEGQWRCFHKTKTAGAPIWGGSKWTTIPSGFLFHQLPSEALGPVGVCQQGHCFFLLHKKVSAPWASWTANIRICSFLELAGLWDLP